MGSYTRSVSFAPEDPGVHKKQWSVTKAYRAEKSRINGLICAENSREGVWAASLPRAAMPDSDPGTSRTVSVRIRSVHTCSSKLFSC